jgi:hypothetical protein
MDQNGENLNRFYNTPDIVKQPSIFAAKTLIEYYASKKKLCVYLDMHAHASKRGDNYFFMHLYITHYFKDAYI